MEQERLQREAYFRNEEEKQAREMIEAQEKAEADATPEAEAPEPTNELVFPEGMSDSEKLLLMTSAITNLTNTINGGNK